MPKKTRKPSGAANIRNAGRKGLLIGMTPRQRELIRVAAAKDGMASGPWVVKVSVAAAEKSGK